MDLQAQADKKKDSDLSVTALYTAQAWAWAGFDGAELFVNDQTRIVFRVTNLFLAIARLFNWRLRSLKISLAHRHALMDRLIDQYGPDLVLEVASGLSRRGYAMSKNPDLLYTEIDRPTVVSQKRALLAAGAPNLRRPNWTIGEGDALKLNYEAHLAQGQRPMVVAEGLFMYLDADQQRAMWNGIATALSSKASGAFIFDLLPQCEQPKPGLFGRFLERLMKLFTGGQAFVHDSRGRDGIKAELLSAGFAKVDVIEPHQVAALYDLPHPAYKSQQLLFVCRSGQDARDHLGLPE